MYPHEMLANVPHNSAGVANMPKATLFYVYHIPMADPLRQVKRL